MKAVLRVLVSLPAVALLLGVGGCSSSSLSPTSPSSVSHGATIQGTVQSGAAASSSELAAFSVGAGIRVTVVGTGLSTTADSSGHFVLQGTPTGTVTLRFEGPGIDARIELGGLVEGQTLTITVQVSGSQAVLVSPPSPATSPTPAPAGKEVELTGTVESVTPPSLMVSGRTVLTSAATRIRRGDHTISLGDLKVGDKVEVEGTQQADGGLLASQIRLEDDEDENEAEVEFKGRIDSISPPTLVVSGRLVVTNGSTRIRRGDKTVALADLKKGEKVEVEGTRQANGSVLASKVKVEDENDDDDDEN